MKEDKKTRRVHMVFSESEYKKINEKAKKLGLSFSAYIRMKALKEEKI
jgi:predicted DNA binding CopG/RHH family protein